MPNFQQTQRTGIWLLRCLIPQNRDLGFILAIQKQTIKAAPTPVMLEAPKWCPRLVAELITLGGMAYVVLLVLKGATYKDSVHRGVNDAAIVCMPDICPLTAACSEPPSSFVLAVLVAASVKWAKIGIILCKKNVQSGPSLQQAASGVQVPLPQGEKLLPQHRCANRLIRDAWRLHVGSTAIASAWERLSGSIVQEVSSHPWSHHSHSHSMLLAAALSPVCYVIA